ncbi:hypothetical protein Tco_0483904 [Tanacetum coccineum]
MRRASKGYTGVEILLFPTMLVQDPDVQGEGSTYPVESYHTYTNAPPTSQLPISSTSKRITRQEYVVPQPRSPTHTNVADEAASTGVDVRLRGATTTVSVTGLQAGQGSGNINKTPTMPYDSLLPRVYTLRSDEGRMQHNELMDFVRKLSDRVVALETDLTQTKKVYGAAFTKLIKKVKRLEKKDKLNKSRRKLRLVLSDEESSDLDILAQEDPSKQGRKIAQIDEDEGITLVQMGVSTTSIDFTNANVPVTTAVSIRRSTKAKTKDKASSINIEEWEDIQARIEAGEELAQSYKKLDSTAVERKFILIDQKSLLEATMKRVNTFTPMESDVDRTIPKIAAGSSKRDAEEELGQEIKLWSLVRERFNSTEPTEDKEIEIWVELKRLFEPDADDELWKSQKHIHDITWRLYDTCGVNHVSTKDGMDIYMLVEREYPLSRGVLTHMLVAKLLVEQDNEMSRELLRKIFM